MARRLPPYLPISIDFDTHPKVAPLTDQAFRLHVSAMLYCKRHKTDGIFPAIMVESFVRRLKKASIAELVDRMLWIEVDGGRHYQINDWTAWNLTGAEAMQRSQDKAAAAHARWDR